MIQNVFGGSTPTKKEIWKNEPNKFRQWMILFGITLVIFIGLSISSFILVLITKQDLVDLYTKSFVNSGRNANASLTLANTTVLSQYLLVPAVSAILTIGAFGFYMITLIQSYKMKSFSKISPFAVYYAEFIGIFAIFDVMAVIRTFNIIGGHTGAVIAVVSKFFAILLFFFALQVSRIRKTFIQVERMELMQNNPEFQQMQDQMKNFFNQAQTGKAQKPPFGNNPSNPTKPKAPTREQPVESKEVTQLKKLKITELRGIAKKLSISGSEKMPKEELIEFIIRSTNKN